MEEDSASKGLASQIALLGRAALKETKRNARRVALKAKIEKLARVDVAGAQYTLGKRAYELRVVPERFSGMYEGLEAIEKEIETKRAGITTEDGEKTMEYVKNAAISAKMKAEAEALSVKLKHAFIVLGREVESAGDLGKLTAEMNGVRGVRQEIEDLEKNLTALTIDHGSLDEVKNASVKIRESTRASSMAFVSAGKVTLLRHMSKVVICVAAALFIGGLVWGIKRHHGLALHTGERGSDSTNDRTIADLPTESMRIDDSMMAQIPLEKLSDSDQGAFEPFLHEFALTQDRMFNDSRYLAPCQMNYSLTYVSGTALELDIHEKVPDVDLPTGQQTLENGGGGVIITIDADHAPDLAEICRKYEEWRAASIKENLAHKIEKKLSTFGDATIYFVTPDKLRIEAGDDFYIGPDDVNVLIDLFASVPAMRDEVVDGIKKAVADHAVSKKEADDAANAEKQAIEKADETLK